MASNHVTTANWIDNQKNLMLFSGRAHPELAAQVSAELGIEVTPQTARDFANGEIFVRFEDRKSTRLNSSHPV